MTQVVTLKMSSTLPKMTPKEFLLQLPEAHDLACDDACPVCLEKYAPTKASAPGLVERFFSMVVPREPEPINPRLELAVRLPCQHVLGLRCIKRWVSPVEGGQCTCPYVGIPAEFSLTISYLIASPRTGSTITSHTLRHSSNPRIHPSQKENKKARLTH